MLCTGMYCTYAAYVLDMVKYGKMQPQSTYTGDER